MCLPIKFLQVFITINCGFFLLLGIISVISSLMLLDSQITETALLQFAEGLIIVTLGLMGLIGQRKQNVCIMAVYNGGVIGLGIVTLFVTFTLFIMEQELESQQTCTNSAVLNHYNIKLQVQKAQEQFCKSNCICYISDDTQWPNDHYLYDNRITYTDKQSKVIDYFDCEKPLIFGEKLPQILSTLEQEYQCAGWCKPNPIYLFSNVNRGVPQALSGCYDFYMREYYNQVEQAFFVYFLMDIMYICNLLFSCCLCIHPHKKKRFQRIYEKIQYEMADF